MEIVELDPAQLIPYAKNPRINDQAVGAVAESIQRFGFQQPIVCDESLTVIVGHTRLKAALQLGLDVVPVHIAKGLSKNQIKAYRLADNKTGELATWDFDLLAEELGEIEDIDVDLGALGFDLGDIEGDEVDTQVDRIDDVPEPPAEAVTKLGDIWILGNHRLMCGDSTSADDVARLMNGEKANLCLTERDRFMIAPFSVINTRDGWWQARKAAWISSGISSEVGRDGFETYGSALTGSGYDKKKALEVKLGRTVSVKELSTLAPDALLSRVSIFDPVLCEVAYRWFSPMGGVVIDPFAGGSVRGIVAGKLGRKYYGIDIRQEQIDANAKQARGMFTAEPGYAPDWRCGDGLDIAKHLDGVKADILFSCPPYADLEVYSDDERDISNMAYPEFREAYRAIIKNACGLLRDDRFALFVVSEVRGKKGEYCGLVQDTIGAFSAAGLRYYNELALINVCGTASTRAARPFVVSRKVTRVHQNILVFIKGDERKATLACGDVDLSFLEGEALDQGGLTGSP